MSESSDQSVHTTSFTQTEPVPDTGPSILSSIVKGVERTPGNIVGAPVDISNIVMGVLTGNGLHGFTPKPVGGSESINSVFGLDNSSTKVPTSQSITEFVTGLINPASAAKTAMIVGLPLATRTGFAMEKFAQMEQAGAGAAETFTRTGIFQGSTDKLLRTAISDSESMLRTSSMIQKDGKMYVPMNATVGSVLDHPQLFDQYPQLKKIKLDVMAGKPGEAAYNAKENTIFLAGAETPEQIRNALLHELQHGVQKIEGFSSGTNISRELGSEGVNVVNQLRAAQKSNPAEHSVLQDKINALMNGAISRYKSNPGEQEAQFTELMKNQNQFNLNEYIANILSEGKTTQNWNK